ncbi:MAG: hypothetical protein EXQ86_08575 [Rhodospirillales bacterium]|nr:hypothetical protein [Rhodospirillales bacterium]
MTRALHCFAEGREGEWEAICLDLDIAVQGASFEDVFRSLPEAIDLYVEAAAELPEADRKRLLGRPAPLGVRLKFLALAFKALIREPERQGKQYHQFTMPVAVA